MNMDSIADEVKRVVCGTDVIKVLQLQELVACNKITTVILNFSQGPVHILSQITALEECVGCIKAGFVGIDRGDVEVKVTFARG